jgi:bacteriorhodopsin
MSKFTNFVVTEVTTLAVSYLAGLTASTLVSRFFVKKGLVNLWGLAAKREAVDKDTYGWLMFTASYAIGLAVMLVVSYAMKNLRQTPPPAA